jgi:pyrroline-5-carboxylate reductase
MTCRILVRVPFETMSATERLVFVGGGKMAEALLGGILSAVGTAGPAPQITVVEALESRRAYLADAFPAVTIAADLAHVTAVTAAVIAVKPNDVQTVCTSLATNFTPGARVLSIAAGVTIGQLESWLGADARVIRSMPNTPALVGKGAAGVAGGSTADPHDVAWALELLGKVGVAVEVPEAKLDAVTGLSGSGPAYIFLVAEALIEAGVFVGLPRDTAELLAKQTILGAATLLSESGQDAAVLRANVTSPGGTTAAGLRALENHGVRAAFIDAVAEATKRAYELSSPAN